MQGVVSLLDPEHHRLVKGLWAELKRNFGVRRVYQAPEPHFSYQLARNYDVKSLEPILQRFARSKTAFQVRTAGLGIFTGPNPVIYIPVVRSPELIEFHDALWEEISSTATDIEDHYESSLWIPHITLGIEDINKDNLSHIVRFLAERDFTWEITVDNLTLIWGTIFPLYQKTTSIFEFAEVHWQEGIPGGVRQVISKPCGQEAVALSAIV
jgi:2'-5' RNA ligase